jgi:NAD(P)-dependent dehydrogenase (short-subunit alcohol dehydrogenase family)
MAEGDRVVALDRNESLLMSGCPTDYVVTDVTDEASVAKGFAEAATKMGGIDVLVSSAGVPSRGTVSELTVEEWNRVFDINVKGVFLCARQAIPELRRAGGGCIINVASQLGIVGAAGAAAYCASKGAVIMLTRAMAIDHAAERIRVNCVCPGSTDTPLADAYFASSDDPVVERRDFAAAQLHGRLIEPTEVADAIAFLASPGATSVVGTALVVDAGYSIR